jgi:hypothetical protein
LGRKSLKNLQISHNLLSVINLHVQFPFLQKLRAKTFNEIDKFNLEMQTFQLKIHRGGFSNNFREYNNLDVQNVLHLFEALHKNKFKYD